MFDFTEVDVSDDIAQDDDLEKQSEIDSTPSISVAVSYTHLTLPTNREV